MTHQEGQTLQKRCEDCQTKIHPENPGVMVSGDFICPECAPRYDHVFPAKEWDPERGCWKEASDA